MTATPGDLSDGSTTVDEAAVLKTARIRSCSALQQRLLIAASTVIGLAGLFVADAASRRGHPYGVTSVPFWLGLLLIFCPLAYRAIAPDVDRRERLVLVVLLGVAFYLVKLLASPDAFTFSDEYVHVRNTQDILRTHGLFAHNPLLPTAAYYPGLGALTAGLVELTGLSIFVSGLIIIGVARLVFSASLYLAAEKVTGSDRAAAGASLVYAVNPMFLFWCAAFSYENLALPLAGFVTWWLIRTRAAGNWHGAAAAAVGVLTVTVTHHVVGFALAAVLGTWWLMDRIFQPAVTADGREIIAGLALLSSAATLVWFFVVARPAPSYLLTNNLLPALRQTGSLLVGHVGPRALYTSGGLQAPTWEKVAGFAAIAILLTAIPVALRRAWWSSPAPMAVAILMAIAYPVSLLPRLAPDGVAISGRSSEYVFAGLGCLIGLVVTDPPTGTTRLRGPLRFARDRWRRPVVITGLAAIVFVGNVTIGTAFYQRLPEATKPKGDPWSVQPDAIAAAKWARSHLGVNHRFAADSLDSYALATYGGQDTASGDQIWPIFFARTMSPTVVRHIQTSRVRYLFVDWRTTRGVPPTPGYYFSGQEPGAGQYRHAFPARGLVKFSGAPCTRLRYRNGAVRIFDVSQIALGTCRLLRAARSVG